MSILKAYHVTHTQMSKVPASHGLDSFTRLYMKLSRLPQVARVQAPTQDLKGNDYRVSDVEKDIVWIYRVERRLGVTWQEVDAAVAKAFSEFMSACAVS